jgi:hypothetical protein
VQTWRVVVVSWEKADRQHTDICLYLTSKLNNKYGASLASLNFNQSNALCSHAVPCVCATRGPEPHIISPAAHPLWEDARIRKRKVCMM